MNPNELTITFKTIESTVLPNKAEVKKPDKNKSAGQLQHPLLSPYPVRIISQEATDSHHHHKHQKANLQRFRHRKTDSK